MHRMQQKHADPASRSQKSYSPGVSRSSVRAKALNDSGLNMWVVGSLPLFLFALVLVFWGFFSFAIPADAAQGNQSSTSNQDTNIVLSVEPSSADAALWTLARQTMSGVDQADLAFAAQLSPELTQVNSTYNALKDAITKDSAQRVHFQVEGISWNLVTALQMGNLTQSAFFAAATDVTPITDAQAADSELRTVTVSHDMSDSERILGLIDNYNAALGQLDQSAKGILSGNLADNLQSLDDEQLKLLVAGDDAEVSAAAQLQLDRRLSENLPDLTVYSNGQLPAELLCEIPWAKDDQLLCAAMDNFIRLNEAFKAEFGTDLPILDGYRPLSEQQYVHANDPNWTAVPGTSNHGWGAAIDFNWDIFKNFDDPEVVWMIENGPKFGWRHPTALGPDTDRPEPWHYEFGSSYSNDNAADFQGPVPEVVYLLKTKTS